MSASQFLTFHLNGQTYGLPISTVREINRMAEITPVPRVPEFVVGVMNLRGKVVPVLDLRKRLGLPATAPTKESCIVVVEGPEGEVGMIVDSVAEVIELPDETRQAPPKVAADSDYTTIGAFARRDDKLILILDVGRTLVPDASSFEAA